MITHRCKNSIENGISIRYTNPYPNYPTLSNKTWWLLKNHFDLDYDVNHLIPITTIQYCPFCGERLEINESI